MKKYTSLRFGKSISFLVDKKAIIISLILLAVSVAVFLVSAGRGEMYISPLEVAKTLFGNGSDMNEIVIYTFRLPRIFVALFAGMSLAVAGAILQGMIRNPLASPDVLGITGGAAAAVVTFLTLFSDENHSLTISIHWLPFAAFLGATVTALLVYVLSWKNGIAPLRLVLIGVGISALMQACTTLLMITGPIYRASQSNVWITGSVYGASWKHVTLLAPWALVLLTISFLSARKMNIQELGDELAIGAGVSLQKQRFFLLLLSTALTGGAVAFAGGIGFVGLMAPHMARRLVGSSFGALLPASALLGAILVMAADLAGRTLFAPMEVPAGVFTAAVGAPYFIYLLYKNR
ncbi:MULTISPECIES: iron ABC transporter permease [unclassified Geobacillus]|uniref:FecCD family ABC transporter permease n=1 Tax=unclassified Geobacillus TaxID=2642459 RepID=UPI000D3D4990|nr:MULTISPECIES: iron ABC transporter permease [unclassified Geobacillus]PUF89506.1 iron ABC transporter permease [Geobacillus sp. LYN3]RDV22820.1 iron ABC transporter permease [Parageobacillus toebii]TXK88495.1 iron ABC transporter permease [Geobacillus sp. AYS3]